MYLKRQKRKQYAKLFFLEELPLEEATEATETINGQKANRKIINGETIKNSNALDDVDAGFSDLD